MFTGIVQGTASVLAMDKGEGAMTVTLELGTLGKGLLQGASVAVAGVCLTARDIHDGRATFDMMGETIEKTSLGDIAVGDQVNVERSARLGDEIGGHRVSGHVTGTGTIAHVATSPGNRILTIRVDSAWMAYVFPKGFVAVDGCSLTVVETGKDYFTVHLIPETLQVTTFGEKGEGAAVNVELDPETVTIVETVKRYMGSKGV